MPGVVDMIRTYNNVLDEHLIKNVMDYFKSIMGAHVWGSSIGWDQNLSLISSNTLTHRISNKTLEKEIKSSIETALDVDFEKEELTFVPSIYVWGGGSYITWHPDECYPYNGTIYLNEEWDSDEEEYDPNSTVGVPSSQVKPQQQQQQSRNKEDSKTQRLKEFQLKNSGNQIDFQGTRVFVQGLPEHATWKDLKDHFQQSIDGSEVVYASVSMDRDGISKQCGIVQFETPTMAKTAIREMRNFPLHGSKLYVREDVQESRRDGGGGRQKKENDSPPDEWKRANDETRDGGGKEWYILKDEELQEIEGLIELRDQHRKKRNYKMSDGIREQLKEDFGVHLDDRLKLWWTDTEHGGAPSIVSDIKGDGRWGSLKPWRQIPTTPENDALVDTDHVMMLLNKRDKARRRKDFGVADDLLQKAHDAAQGELGLRIHDESRTWRIWTERPPPKHNTLLGYEDLSPEEMCLKIVKDNEPDKVDEMRAMLRKFPGREWSVFKRLRGRYNARDE